MPTQQMTSWADEIDDTEISLPRPSEKWEGNKKITTEFTTDEDDKKIKIIRTYKVEKKLVSKSIAKRKALPKFGMSRDDGPGPNAATTVVAEECFMNFIANKDENEKEAGPKSAIDIIKDKGGVVKCRICKEDHWTTNCPYKDTLGPLRETLDGAAREKEEEKPEKPAAPTTGGKYVPPNVRDGSRVGQSMPDRKRAEDTAAIRVSNLSENVIESDLQDLFRPFGNVARIYLAKDKQTNQCKGFAFINYSRKEDAAKAIQALNGYGYDHLILNVEWAKPAAT